ncbi:hypothetical protein [Hydrogenophaga sp.]|uniref:hypothetical protein n=1 Tax=Hydrogenophaga sp. TaxID=1904254 RepID=UPI002621A334|nr:hypothetical protein [Hydrogenophaga sp.]
MVTLTQIVEDYFSRTDQANSTRAMVRAAILWVIRSGKVDFTEDSQNALNLLESFKGKDGPKVTIPRPKIIPSKDLNLLLDVLYGQAERKKSTRVSIRTVAWIRAGLVCGARPIEWFNTEWVDDAQTQLRIKNAKVKLRAPAFLRKQAEESDASSFQTSHDQELEELKYWEASVDYEAPTEQSHRIVPIDNNIDRETINMHLGFIQEIVSPHLDSIERAKAFKNYYLQTRKTLYRACRKIWGNKKLYTLYTMRGQFSANMKAAKGSAATAALMGHSSETTPSASHYGKANQAYSRFKTGRASAMPQRQVPSPEQDNDRGPIE